jgi:phage tail protein X
MIRGDTLTARAHAGETLDALVWRTLGWTAGAVEAALEANPGLADAGPHLAAGRAVVLPASVTAARPAAAPLLQLWD